MKTPMYKLVRPDGTDFFSGTVNYAENVGKIIRVKDCDPPEKCWVGKGIYASTNPIDSFKFDAKIPCRAFRVEGIGLLYEDDDEYRFKALRVKEEITDLNSLLRFNYTEAVSPLNPLLLPPTPDIGLREQTLLLRWGAVCSSAWGPVRAVRSAAYAAVRDSVWNSIWYSVWPVCSVHTADWGLVKVSVRAAMWAYTGSLFPTRGTYPFQPAVDLWRQGIVPSFDGNTWRLHNGRDAKVVFEWEMR